MPSDRLVSFEVSGLRSLEHVELPLNGLTVLIGENGSGKSSIVEAFELMRKLADPRVNFIAALNQDHGGLRNLLRQGAQEIEFRLRIEPSTANGEAPIVYVLSLGSNEGNSGIVQEKLSLESTQEDMSKVIWRDRGACQVFDPREGKMQPLKVSASIAALTEFGAFAPPAVERVLEVLRNGQVHVPFDVRPLWIKAEVGDNSDRARDPSVVAQVTHLSRLGTNLANCFFTLSQTRPRETWKRILELARAGLGTDLTEIRTPPATRGQIELQLLFRSLPRAVPASALSDGQLAYLAFIALTQLSDGASFVVFDEPETHMHPELLVRVAWMLEELATKVPVIVATQSDQLLDALLEPAKSVVLCELDVNRATRLLRPDPEMLARWLERYRGLGTLRAEGNARSVFKRAEAESGESR